MNLIEKLGGYERAKIIQGSREMGGLPADLDLEDALLEYRRQHNIFEAGDLVVCDSFNDVIGVVGLYEDRLVIDTGIKTTPDSKNTMAMTLPVDMFRHATDAEIEAGKRLEVV